MNKKAIASVVLPENYENNSIHKLMKIYHLREDFSERKIELNLEIIEKKKLNFKLDFIFSSSVLCI